MHMYIFYPVTKMNSTSSTKNCTDSISRDTILISRSKASGTCSSGLLISTHKPLVTVFPIITSFNRNSIIGLGKLGVGIENTHAVACVTRKPQSRGGEGISGCRHSGKPEYS